ncbi:MAG: hypothetical protein HFI26_16275 [Lachnospiraceae bacterium]|jgi:hypothetical protein|nr:hypothetical protein [Lachnospiraceae bacterium]
MEGFEMTAGRSVTAEMVTSRQTQEVQGQIIMAKKFPRNYVESCNRIMQACQRKGLAEKAMYEYPRGGTKVIGPSIRLAEALAQNWGNMSFGIVELEQKAGESQVMAYAWDLETNTRQEKIFSVPHIRSTRKGNVSLTDPRDIYEMVANQGARRLRSCILGIVPGDVVEDALEQCNKTLVDGEKKPLADVIKEVCLYFQRDYNIPIESLEKYIGCKADSFSMNDCIRLRKVYNSIKDGMAKREEIFELPGVEKEEPKDPFEEKKKDEKSVEGQQQLDLGGGADETK